MFKGISYLAASPRLQSINVALSGLKRCKASINVHWVALYSNQRLTMPQKFDIDLRSDTVTTPTLEMRQAMFDANVGDDVFGEDPTIRNLEEKVSSLLGKEKGLLVTSGTMGNLLSIMSHCWGRGYDIIVGDKSHIFMYEQGGASHLAGVMIKTVPNQADGTLDLSSVEGLINPGLDHHKTKTQLLCLENTQNTCGGVVLMPEYCRKARVLADKHGIAMHLDGARLLNAAVFLKVDPALLVENFDSVNICLSKGLGAPVGSVICGSTSFIERAKRLRKMVGGAWRQAGLLAACGLCAIENFETKLSVDHQNALQFAQTINSIEGIEVDMSSVQTNMVYFKVTSESVSAAQLAEKLGRKDESDDSESVGVFNTGPATIRAVFHHQISNEQALRAAHKIQTALTEHLN